jgi:hypothetical protein
MGKKPAKTELKGNKWEIVRRPVSLSYWLPLLIRMRSPSCPVGVPREQLGDHPRQRRDQSGRQHLQLQELCDPDQGKGQRHQPQYVMIPFPFFLP